MLSAIIISPDEQFRDATRELLEGSDKIEVRAELNNFYSSLDSWIFNEIKTMEADVIIVDVAPDKEQGILTVEKILEISKHSHIFVAGDGTDADAILRSMRAGAKEFLSAPLESQPLFAAIDRVSKVHTVATKERKRLDGSSPFSVPREARVPRSFRLILQSAWLSKPRSPRFW